MHYSVLKNEVINGLNIKDSGIYVDATLGYAGHSIEILQRLRRGSLFAFDQDKEAILYSDQQLAKISQNYKVFHTNFSNLKEYLNNEGINSIDGILFDLGFSSPQIDDISRGFSFMKDANLDMRMNQDDTKTAFDVVNKYSLEKLMQVFYEYGEEKFAKSIAVNIIKSRSTKQIETTLELVKIIEKSVPYKYFIKNHPERQIFQAIRIEVNNELEVLKIALNDAIELLGTQGRICVITFHSLEDRIVKQMFKKYSEPDPIVKGLPEIPMGYEPILKTINRKPITASENEIIANSRSKSAKLRIAERI